MSRPQRPSKIRNRHPWCEIHGDCPERSVAALTGVTDEGKPVVVHGCEPHVEWLHGRRPDMARITLAV